MWGAPGDPWVVTDLCPQLPALKGEPRPLAAALILRPVPEATGYRTKRCHTLGPDSVGRPCPLKLLPAAAWVTNTLNRKLQGTVFSIKAQISCLPGQVLMNATVPGQRGGRAGELGAGAFHVPPQAGQGEEGRTMGEPCAGLVDCWGGGGDLRKPQLRTLGMPPLGENRGSASPRRVQGKQTG